jgi:hypothetical protein
MKRASLLVLAASSVLAACGSTDDGSLDKTNPSTNHPTANDPCGLNSGFEGDDVCIPPPASGEGIQLHAGPANYRDAAAVAPYLLEGGAENVQCFLARIPESGFYYLRQENRMRPGSHHMLINLTEDDGRPEGPATGCSLGALGSIPGSQTPRSDFPKPGTLAPEDAGLARYLPAGAMAAFQLHYVNTGTEPVLREAWVNLYRVDETQVTQRLQTVFLVADRALDIAPKTRATVTTTYAPPVAEPTRIFSLTSHLQAHSESMTVWRVRGDQRELIYQSFDWEEPDSATYNTVVHNPLPNNATKQDGGVSGLLYLEPGDSLEWSCDVNNTLDQRMRFANEAYTAEMCLLAGSYVSNTPGLLSAVCASGQCFGRSAP